MTLARKAYRRMAIVEYGAHVPLPDPVRVAAAEQFCRRGFGQLSRGVGEIVVILTAKGAALSSRARRMGLVA